MPVTVVVSGLVIVLVAVAVYLLVRATTS